MNRNLYKGFRMKRSKQSDEGEYRQDDSQKGQPITVGKGNKRFRTSNKAFGEKLGCRSLIKLFAVNSLTASAPKTLAANLDDHKTNDRRT